MLFNVWVKHFMYGTTPVVQMNKHQLRALIQNISQDKDITIDGQVIENKYIETVRFMPVKKNS